MKKYTPLKLSLLTLLISVIPLNAEEPLSISIKKDFLEELGFSVEQVENTMETALLDQDSRCACCIKHIGTFVTLSDRSLWYCMGMKISQKPTSKEINCIRAHPSMQESPLQWKMGEKITIYGYAEKTFSLATILTNPKQEIPFMECSHFLFNEDRAVFAPAKKISSDEEWLQIVRPPEE